MFTYQSQERALKLKSKAEIKFPSKFKLTLELGPKHSFGSDTPGKHNFFLKGRKNRNTYNANTGRSHFSSNPFLNPIIDNFVWNSDFNVEISSNSINISGSIDDWNSFNGLLEICHYIFPTVLNVNYPDWRLVNST